MKHPFSKTRQSSPPQPRQGFALIVALTLLSFIVLLMVSLSTLVQTELQVATVTERSQEARQNALLALEIAVGQLQKHAGADQRVSVPATTVYPEKNVVEATGDLYNHGGFGYRSFAETANSRSYLDDATTYLTHDERDDWNQALADWWNEDDDPDDVTTGKNPHWTGILNTTFRVDRFSGLNRNSNTITYRADDPQIYENDGADTKFGEFARVGYLGDSDLGHPAMDEIDARQIVRQTPIWLVSGNEFKVPTDNDYFRPDRGLDDQGLDDDEIVTLVNRAAPGIEEITNGDPNDDPVDGVSGRVTVPKVALRDRNDEYVTGHYAYWISDESTKANFSVRDPYENAPVGSVDYRNRLQVAQGVGWDRMEVFNEIFDNVSDGDRQDIDERLERVASSSQIALVGGGIIDEDQDPSINDAVYRNMHHLTGWSQGLMTNTARGGLRRDLTAYFERNQGTMESDFIPDPDLYDDDPRFAAFGGDNTGFPNSLTSTRFDFGIPTWQDLETWYDNEASGAGGGSISPDANTFPMITYVNVHMGFTYDPITAVTPGGSSNSAEVIFNVAPIIILWNPYDVALDGEDYYLDLGVNLEMHGIQISREEMVGDETVEIDYEIESSDHLRDHSDGNDPDQGQGPWYWFVKQGSPRTTLGNFHPFSRDDWDDQDERIFTQPSSDGYKPLDHLMKFRIPASETSFEPGESKIFTLAAQVDDWIPMEAGGSRVELQNNFEPFALGGPYTLSFPVFKIQATTSGSVSIGSPPLRFDFTGAGDPNSDSGHNGWLSPYVALALNESDLPLSDQSLSANPLIQTLEMGSVDHRAMNVLIGENRVIPPHDQRGQFFNPPDTQNPNSYLFPVSRCWMQPFTGDGADPFRMASQLPALANFNLTRSANAHPSIDAFRSYVPSNNEDGMRRLSFMQGAPTDSPNPIYATVSYDENQSTGIGTTAFSLITFQDEETIDGSSFEGQRQLPFRNARRADSEILSIGRMQEANLSRHFWQPFAPIGNANAPIYVDREAIAGLNGQELFFDTDYPSATFSPTTWYRFQGNRSEQQMQPQFSSGNKPYLYRHIPANLSVDISYLLNESLWDDFFFSTILDTNYDATEPLPNSRMRFTPDAFNMSGGLLGPATEFDTAAAFVRYHGPMNVNSTSVEAWKALLTAFRGLELADNPDETVPVARTLDPVEDSIEFFDDRGQANLVDIGATSRNKDYSKVVGGLRYLDDAQIERLAERIVDEVRLRGPFFSIADFVNRRLVGPDRSGGHYEDARTTAVGSSTQADNNGPGYIDERYDPFLGLQGLNGTLQRAINVSGINGGVNHPRLGDDGESSGIANDRVYSLRIKSGGGENAVSDPRSVYESSGIGGSANRDPKHSIEPALRSHVDMEHVASAPAGESGHLLNGAPGFVTQADILAMIGPALTARGDTFMIRTYGDAIDPLTGEVISRAWIEAIVQRTALPVEADGNNDYQYVNSFGRKFEIVSVRWLSEDEV